MNRTILVLSTKKSYERAHEKDNFGSIARDLSFLRRIDTKIAVLGLLQIFISGLLTLTGVLWGCTNPFIRQGTKGLRDVKAKTLPGQAWAEVTFLLGNWRYVVPWLVNQAGSLVYLLAVQRAPLSLCVPVANGLAFAGTALAGAASGTEQPLSRGSILGIALIVAGTALCCLDNTS